MTENSNGPDSANGCAHYVDVRDCANCYPAALERRVQQLQFERDQMRTVVEDVAHLGIVHHGDESKCTGSSIRCCLCGGGYEDSSDVIHHDRECAWVLARRLVSGK